MICRALTQADTVAVCRVMQDSFAASEGPDEGALIGRLARDLMSTTPHADLHAFGAFEEGAMIGAILFTRLLFTEDPRTALLLSPVAVASARQGKGVGQTLLRFGLAAIRDSGADVAVTYGDPNYYRKVGFLLVTQADLPPPHPLGQPHGWLAQSLVGGVLTPFKGRSRCAPGLDDPAYW